MKFPKLPKLILLSCFSALWLIGCADHEPDQVGQGSPNSGPVFAQSLEPTLPEAVSLKRFFTPLLVFSFGISRRSG